MNRKEEKRKITRQKVIEAATHLFARQGYHKTTIQEIARHIDMTTGAVFHYFSSKRVILDAVVEKHYQNMEQYVTFLGKDHGSYETMLKGLVKMFVRQYHTNPDAIIGLTSLSAELSETGMPVVKNIQAAYDCFVDAFESSIVHLPETIHKRAVAVSFISGIQGLAVQALLRKKEINFEQLAQGFIDIHIFMNNEQSGMQNSEQSGMQNSA
ncbi:MAG: TetR/AcrR family transcriptional regulator [Thermodesulfobacteriota bacterium]|nr:TetR/AcrR family transcriptional regulator [Thermodesulfobacteriota bacterium]